jgi:hypothetical protein
MSETLNETTTDDGWEWAIVEIMGFRKHAGRCREEERFGAKLLRVDIPIKGDPATNGWETHYYSGQSMFSYTPTDQDSVMRANKPYEPPSTYRLPAPEIEIRAGEQMDDDDGLYDDRPSETDRIKAIADRAEARSRANGGA